MLPPQPRAPGHTSRQEGALGESFKALGESFKAPRESLKVLWESSKARGESFKALGESFRAQWESSKALWESFKALGERFRALGESFKALGESFRALGESFKALWESFKALGESFKAQWESSKVLWESFKALGESFKALGEGLKALGESLKAPRYLPPRFLSPQTFSKLSWFLPPEECPGLNAEKELPGDSSDETVAPCPRRDAGGGRRARLLLELLGRTKEKTTESVSSLHDLPQLRQAVAAQPVHRQSRRHQDLPPAPTVTTEGISNVTCVAPGRSTVRSRELQAADLNHGNRRADHSWAAWAPYR
ncbi:UPF0134 protein [Liparis tanakae]|uniref:UPF0134 protein n=1 Tax=Liparis tanakae TaxID=230148 RepID=A0A4Z2FUE5_9TELE|nr:UPF0134 protein [Liparis tanakae]